MPPRLFTRADIRHGKKEPTRLHVEVRESQRRDPPDRFRCELAPLREGHRAEDKVAIEWDAAGPLLSLLVPPRLRSIDFPDRWSIQVRENVASARVLLVVA